MEKILYVITSLSVGGAQKALLNLASSEFSRDYPPQVITLVEVEGLQQQFAQAGIPLHVLGLNRLGQWLLLLPRLLGLVWRIRPHIIHGWQHHGNLFATLAWLLAGCRPHLWWGIHHTPEQATLERAQHALVIRLGRWLSSLPEYIIYVSQRSLQRHTELGYDVRRARVIANGIAVDTAIDPAGSRSRVRQELAIPPDALLIGSLTRHVPEKDIPNLLAAIRLFQQQGGQAHFLLAGEGMGSYNPALPTLLADLPEPGRVHLLGVRSDAARLIAALDVATLSSRREAFPLFLAEAMAAGVPCVATDVGDVAVCVADTGLIVPVGDAAALAQAWGKLLHLEPAQRQVLGERARQRVVAHFSLDAVVDAYRKMLRQTAG